MNFNSFEHTYDPIAKIYNDRVTPHLLKSLIPAIDKLLIPRLDTEDKLLDVGCGTGHLAKYLITKGYKVTGIDISEGMLNYAKINAPEAEFYLCSAVDLDFSSTFDGIVSTGALSHIMNLEDIEIIFKNIYKALKKNGIFLLNMYLEEVYQQQFNDNFSFDKSDDFVCVIHDNHDLSEKIGKFDFTTFSLIEGQWQRLDMSIIDKIYTIKEILLTLEKAGFQDISIFDEKHDLKISEMDGCTYFVCYKM